MIDNHSVPGQSTSQVSHSMTWNTLLLMSGMLCILSVPLGSSNINDRFVRLCFVEHFNEMCLLLFLCGLQTHALGGGPCR